MNLLNFFKKENYNQSKSWDMNITFKTLLKHNKFCKVQRPKSFHEEYVVYMKHPDANTNTLYSVIILLEDGFMYDCDINSQYIDHLNLKDGLTTKVLKEIILYNKWKKIYIKNIISYKEVR